jgi:DNA-binding IclR family transcriptional regulator
MSYKNRKAKEQQANQKENPPSPANPPQAVGTLGPKSDNSETTVHMSASKTQSVPTLEKALQIVEALAISKRGKTLSQLSRSLGLPKSSAHSILVTFEREGYLERDEQTGTYRVGPRLFKIANMAIGGVGLREQASPHLRRLKDKTGLTVHMAIPENDEALLIERIAPEGQFSVSTWIGKRMGLHCTSLGKSLLAYASDEDVARLVRLRMLRHNDNTISSVNRLCRELETVRKLGYSLDDEEEELGIRCLGAPVFDHAGDVVAAISVTGDTRQIAGERLTAFVQMVKSTAQAISSQLGCKSYGPNAPSVAEVPPMLSGSR